MFDDIEARVQQISGWLNKFVSCIITQESDFVKNLSLVCADQAMFDHSINLSLKVFLKTANTLSVLYVPAGDALIVTNSLDQKSNTGSRKRCKLLIVRSNGFDVGVYEWA